MGLASDGRFSRRGFLKATAAGAAALAAAGPLAAGEKKKIPVGLQLYSVRKDCEKDLPAVLQAVAKMGYKGVEFAGYYGRKADELRKLLDDNGLVCCGTHTAIGTLLGDALKGTIEFHKTLGNKYLVVPGLGKEYTGTKENWLKSAKLFAELADRVKPEGMLVGYHNHGAEFKPIDGEMPWDIFYGNTSPAVIMQLDTGNCMSGGGDPIHFLKKYPGRAVTVHLKEHGGKGDFGDGNMKWKETFELCETIGGTEWYIIEQETYARPPMECVKVCIDKMREWGKV